MDEATDVEMGAYVATCQLEKSSLKDEFLVFKILSDRRALANDSLKEIR